MKLGWLKTPWLTLAAIAAWFSSLGTPKPPPPPKSISRWSDSEWEEVINKLAAQQAQEDQNNKRPK